MINSEELVPGDIIIINKGQIIPADIRLIETSSDFAVDQSSLTGETASISKNTDPSEETEFEAANMVWFGTSCLKGSARGIVVTIGDLTFMGRVAMLAISIEDYSDLWVITMNKYKTWMSSGVCCISLLLFIFGFVFNDEIVYIVWFCSVFMIILIGFPLIFKIWNSRYQLIKSVADTNMKIKSMECLMTMSKVNILCAPIEHVLMDEDGNVVPGLKGICADIKNSYMKLVLFANGGNMTSNTDSAVTLIVNEIGEDKVKTFDLAQVDTEMYEFLARDEVKNALNEYDVIIFCWETDNWGLVIVDGIQRNTQYLNVVCSIGYTVEHVPCLKRSDVGISFNDNGYCTDICKEASDIICLSSSLEDVVKCIQICKDNLR